LFVIIVIYAYFIDISQGSVRCIYSVVGYVKITSLQIVSRVCQWKNFENRSIIGEDMDKIKVPRFFGPPCIVFFLRARANIAIAHITYGNSVCPSVCLDSVPIQT